MQRLQLLARRVFSLGQVPWRETLGLMAVAGAVPFLVHLVPWGGTRPLEVHLLPAFWTAFVAVYLCGFRIGAAVALVGPAIQFVATGLPGAERVGLMAIEGVAFAGLAAALVRRWPGVRWAAPLAWLAACALVVAVQWAVPAFESARPPLEHYVSTVVSSLAGLGAMLAINVALVALLPKDRAWDEE